MSLVVRLITKACALSSVIAAGKKELMYILEKCWCLENKSLKSLEGLLEKLTSERLFNVCFTNTYNKQGCGEEANI